MRSSLCRITAHGRSEPTASIAVALGTPAAPLVRRAGLALGPRRPPLGRRLSAALDTGAVPSESRIVFRAGGFARR